MMAVVFRACMIDGFGWFRKGDYRRAWLLFEELEYVLPGKLEGPLWYPRRVVDSDEYTAVWATLEDHGEVARRLIRSAWRDPILRQVCSRVPSADQVYARQVVESDSDMSALIEGFPPHDAVPPLAALSAKLVLRCMKTGSMPIVGKEYAWEIVSRVIHLLQANTADPKRLTGELLDERQGATFSRLSAGLSLRFVSDDAIVDAPFDKLRHFKEVHTDLLRQHNLNLADVAQRFDGLPSGKEFDVALRQLKLSAETRRAELDNAAEGAWRAFGLQLGKKALHGALAGLPPILMMTQQRPLYEIAISLLPAAAVIGTTVVDHIEAMRSQRVGRMAYLFEAQRGLDE